MNKVNNKELVPIEIDEQELILMEDSSNDVSSEILFEDTTKRSENVKHFRMKNGQYMAAVYDKPVHTFNKVTGKFVDIAHRFDEKEDCYEAETDRFKARFPKKEGKRKFVTVEKDGRSVSWRYIPATNSHKKHAEASICKHERATLMELPRFPELKYEKTESQTDLEYGITERGVKENIILTKRPKHSTFRFELKLEGLRTVLAEDKKSICLYADDADATEPEFMIPPINMTDAAGVYSEAAHYELVEDDTGTVMEIVVDPEWLLSEERLYPVVVDPQLYIGPTDTYNPWTIVNVKMGSSSDEVDEGLYRIGYDSSGVENRLYMKIRLSEPPEGYKITDATLKLAQKHYKSSGCPIYFDVVGVSEWEKDTISMENLPDVSGTVLDTFKGQTRDSREFIKLNITSQVKKWYKNTQMYGHLAIQVNTDKSCADDCNCASYIDVCSDQNIANLCPMIYFTYMSADTYADHQKYESFEMGRAGTGSVNLFNGMLTFTHSDVSAEGKRLPLSIAHIYRTEYSEEPASGYTYGYGWVLSAAQKLTRENRNDVKAVYRDAQGRRHYLVRNRDGTVTDDAGLGLFYEDCCNTSGGCCCCRLYDEKGNEMCFDANGNMTCMKDSHGNVSKYNYSGDRLLSVVDGSGRTATLEYEDDLLRTITDHKGRTYEYYYSADKLLSRIAYPDGDETVFTYDTNKKLDSVTAPTEVKHQIVYNDRKVETVCQIGANGECGASTRFDYYARSTAVTDTITKLKMVYRMDDGGRVQSSYEDLIETDLAKGGMTATMLENYQNIVNTHNDNETDYSGKYRSLSASVPGTDDQFPNLIKNGNFKTEPNASNDWRRLGMSTSDGIKDETYLRGYKSYYMSTPCGMKWLRQAVTLNSSNIHGNVLVASAWAKASGQVADTSENTDSAAKFELHVKVVFEDDTDVEYTERFDSSYDGWQYVAAPIALTADNPPKSATVTLDYSYNNGSCYFTNVRLFTVKGNTSFVNYPKEELVKEVDGTTYKIRKTITKSDGRITTIDYENKKSDVVLSEIVDADGNTFTNRYSYNADHSLRKSKDYRGLITEYTYDCFGNETKKRTHVSGAYNHYMFEQTDYHDNGVFVKKAYDPRSNELYTKYNYEGDLLQSKVEQNDQTYNYTYNNNTDEMTSVYSTVGGAKPTNEFAYTHGNMTEVTHNGYLYKFTYDGLNRTSSITAGDSPLVSLAYTTAARSTVKSTYGNGFETLVTSDSRGNPIRKTVNGTVVSLAEYDEVGNPVKLIDNLKKVCYTYTYDSDGNVTSVTETPDEGIARINESVYDPVSGRATEKIYDAVNHTYKTIYETDENDHIYPDNTAIGMALVGKYTDQTQRDGFGRINTRRLKYTGKNILADSYTYLNNEIAPGNWRETNFVASVSQTAGEDSVEFAYTYDNSGNIVKIERDGRNYRNYEYDGLNRLTAEDNYEVMRRYEWSYDDGGNITEKRVYVINGSGDEPIATIPYGYDSIWKDKLTSYNGNTGFAYDNLGNPTKYKGIDLTWTNVRRLVSYGNNTFEYGADGIRFKKNNTTYTLDGNRILRETDGTKTLTYYYGTNGVIGFRYNDADYFYHKNLQGDVLAIYDTNGVKQAEYEYDAWGKVLNVIHNDCCCCDVGHINPFRYRSYYYDVETGLYYLQTRYYDPEVGRFINSDALKYLGNGTEFTKGNLFVYCNDNPIMGYDPEGTWDWGKFWTGVVITAVAVAIAASVVISFGASAVVTAAVIGATVATGTALTVGAADNKTVVLDASYSFQLGDYYAKVGFSFVVDFEDGLFEIYPHVGGGKGYNQGFSYSVGFIENYTGKNSYSEHFIDMSAGYIFGLDHCFDPTKDYSSACKATSITFSTGPSAGVGYDYYLPAWTFGE